jgi:hypothetical protein
MINFSYGSAFISPIVHYCTLMCNRPIPGRAPSHKSAFQSFNRFAPFKALRRFKVQGSRVQVQLGDGSNRSSRSTASLRSKRLTPEGGAKLMKTVMTLLMPLNPLGNPSVGFLGSLPEKPMGLSIEKF